MRAIRALLPLALGACTVSPASSGAPGAAPPGAAGPAETPTVPSTADVALCASRKLTIQSTDGETVSVDKSSAGYSSGGGTFTADGTSRSAFAFRATAQDGTWLRLHGVGASLEVGSSISGPALLERPSTTGGAPSLFCGSPSSAVTRDADAYRFTLRGTSELLDCGSAPPVSGSVQLCVGRNCGDRKRLSGTVDGKSVSSEIWGYDQHGETLVPTLSAGAVVLVELADASPRAALLYVQDQADNGVFCAVNKTVVESGADADRQLEIELTDLRWLGACPRSGEANIEGCAQ